MKDLCNIDSMWIDDIQLHRTKGFERQYIGTKPQSSRIMISIQHLAGNQWFRSSLLIVLLCGVAQAAPPLPDSPTSTERNVWATGCGQCEPSQCPPLPTEGCPQDVIKDACGCCDICDATNATDIIFATEGGAGKYMLTRLLAITHSQITLFFLARNPNFQKKKNNLLLLEN